MTSIYSSAYVT